MRIMPVTRKYPGFGLPMAEFMDQSNGPCPREGARAVRKRAGQTRLTPSRRAWSATAAVTAGATRSSNGFGMM